MEAWKYEAIMPKTSRFRNAEASLLNSGSQGQKNFTI